MPALIVAFDGVLADTLPLRAHALADACAAEFATRTEAQALVVLPGRSMLEAAMALYPEEAERDPTLPELVALRAQRGYRHLVQHGVPMHTEALAAVREASARGTRVVLRADSERRDVAPLIGMAGLDHLPAFVRCGDDLPRAAGASLARSWLAIHARLDGMRIGIAERTAWETSAETAAAATPFVREAARGVGTGQW